MRRGGNRRFGRYAPDGREAWRYPNDLLDDWRHVAAFDEPGACRESKADKKRRAEKSGPVRVVPRG